MLLLFWATALEGNSLRGWGGSSPAFQECHIEGRGVEIDKLEDEN